MKPTRSLLTGVAVLALSALAAGAADYIGVQKCKMCHKLQFDSWSQLEHAKAFEVLKPEERTKAECLKCHATGGKAELPGVQCEACHGPGSGYKDLKIMKDRAASVAAGLVLPDEALCKSCHEKAPHEVPAFSFATMKEKGVHAHKQAAK